VPAIADLGVGASAQLDLPDAPLQCFLQEAPTAPECFVGEKASRRWLEANEGASVDAKPFGFESDYVACCNSFVLEQGLSRETLAVWTPVGLLQPTVLPFGQKNSGTEAQGPCRKAAAELKNISNYVDDWLGYEDDIEKPLSNFEDFLKACLTNNVALNVHKTRFGFPRAQFFGFEVDSDSAGIRLAKSVLTPWRTLCHRLKSLNCVACSVSSKCPVVLSTTAPT
jgi:hypothetical protein